MKLNHDFSDSSYRRLVACCIRPPTEGGRMGAGRVAGLRPAQKDLRHTHSCLAAAVFACQTQRRSSRTQETLTNLVTLV